MLKPLNWSLSQSMKKMMINIDGEYGGDAPMKFKNLKRHIEIFANTQAIPKRAITEVKRR